MMLEIKFSHRYISDGTWQSICPECHKTVTESREEGGRHLVPARDQCTSWQFHDWTDPVGGLWRYSRCSGHRFIAKS
jgi:hypothetical protein